MKLWAPVKEQLPPQPLLPPTLSGSMLPNHRVSWCTWGIPLSEASRSSGEASNAGSPPGCSRPLAFSVLKPHSTVYNVRDPHLCTHPMYGSIMYQGVPEMGLLPRHHRADSWLIRTSRFPGEPAFLGQHCWSIATGPLKSYVTAMLSTAQYSLIGTSWTFLLWVTSPPYQLHLSFNTVQNPESWFPQAVT